MGVTTQFTLLYVIKENHNIITCLMYIVETHMFLDKAYIIMPHGLMNNYA